MKKLISFSKFLALPKEIQEQLSTLPNEYLQEELSPKDTKRKMLELERALKQKDWTYFASDDGRDRKRGEVENEKIIKMRDELGADGNALFDMYYQKLMPKYFREDFMGVREARKDSRPSHYEKFLYKKMKEWDIQSLDDLEGEAKKRFDKELEDYEGDGEDEVEVNMPNMGEELFPEMSGVKGRGTIDYGERGTNEKSLTASTFCDAGNLAENHPKWIAPTNNRRSKY